jgi:Cys-tRNA synthase (O-phospho-L-seryl-tRNA:Cys-tRNA synthase)
VYTCVGNYALSTHSNSKAYKEKAINMFGCWAKGENILCLLLSFTSVKSDGKQNGRLCALTQHQSTISNEVSKVKKYMKLRINSPF